MIRFKKEDGSVYPDWKQFKLKEIAVYKKGFAFKAKDYKEEGVKIIRVSDLGYDYIKKTGQVCLSLDKKDEYLDWELKENDLIITTVGSKPPVYSSLVGKVIKVTKEFDGCLLNQNAIRVRTREGYSQIFLYYVFLKKRYISFLESIMRGNANQGNITVEDLFGYEIFIPTIQEQERIAEFLSSVDDIIQVQEEKISTLEEQKRGVLQKLFNREVRFKADDGSEYSEWEEKKFDEIFNVIPNNTFSRDCLNDRTGEVLNIHYGDVLIKYGAFIDVGEEEVPFINADIQLNKFGEKSYLHNGDIIIADTAEDMIVGKATEIYGAIEKKILSGLHTIPCRPKMTFASKYLGYYINSEKYHNQLMPLIQGIKVSSISKSNINKTVISYPCMDEQQKIADCLSAYDEAIQIKKDKLEVWKEIKKGLLQQMFV